MKNLLDLLKEAFGTISVVFSGAASVFSVMHLGEFITILIAICAFILYMGLSITVKMMDKE